MAALGSPSAASGRRASAGGARGAGGVVNQANVTAWLASLVVAEQPAPWLPGAAILAVGGETGLDVDDVGAVTDRGGFLVVQAKGSLRLSGQPTSAFGQAVGQVVGQYLAGLPDEGRESRRAIDAARDRLAIVGDGRSSQPVRELATVTARLRTLPDEMPLSSAATSLVQVRALTTLLDQLRGAWTAATDIEPSEEDVRGVLRVLVVDGLDLAEGGADRAAATAHLRSVLLDPSVEVRAWSALHDLGAMLARDRAWQRRVDLAASLDAAGAPVGPAGRHAADIEVLRRLTEGAIAGLASHAVLPTAAGAVHCDRSAVDELADADGSFVVVGDPGCGKSGVIYELATRLRHGEDVVVLTVDTLPRSSMRVRAELGLTGDLFDTLRAWSGAGSATLVLDGLDAARGEGTTWLTRLCDSLPGTRWRVIASIRRFDLRHSAGWQQTFAGEPLHPGSDAAAPDLTQVRHYLLGHLSDDDLARLAASSPAIAGLLEGASPRLRDLVKNPFNLRLAAELLMNGASVASLADTQDQLHLLQRYWRLRVLDTEGGPGRVRVLTSVTTEMLRTRRLRADTAVVPAALLDATEALLRDGVLQEVPSALLADACSLVSYSHHILFDFAVAALVLTSAGQSRLAAALGADPNLGVVARPSLDLHLTDLWRADADHATFGSVLRDLVTGDHPVAGVGAARVATEHVDHAADVAWLVSIFDDGDVVAAATITAWICGAMDAAEPRLVERIKAALTAWADLAAAAAGSLERSFDPNTAQTLARMLFQIEKIDPLAPGAGAAEVRARCAARLLDLCLAAPQDRAWLASRAAQFLPAAVTVDAAHAQPVLRSIEPCTVEAFGPEMLRHYVEDIGLLAEGDPATASAVLQAVWRWRETSDETTYITQGVLNLTSTRKQDVDHVRWLSGEKFPVFAQRAGLRHALTVVAAAVDSDRAEYASIPPSPLEAFGAYGTLLPVAHDLDYSDGHGAALKIVESFIGALGAAGVDEEHANALVAAMVESISHPEFWRRVLDVASADVTWRRPVGAVLASGALLHDTETRAAAGRLMTALSPTLGPREHEELLEEPIQRAAALYPPDAAEWRERAVDQLVGCLDPDHVQSPELQARLARLLTDDGPPAIPEPSGVEVFCEPTGLADVLGAEVHNTLIESARAALEDLRRALDATQNEMADDPVAVLEPALRAAVAEAGPAPAEPVQELITRAAERLTQESAVRPGTALGRLVIELVTAATDA